MTTFRACAVGGALAEILSPRTTPRCAMVERHPDAAVHRLQAARRGRC